MDRLRKEQEKRDRWWKEQMSIQATELTERFNRLTCTNLQDYDGDGIGDPDKEYDPANECQAGDDDSDED